MVKKSNHIPRIDILRAVAILIVFSVHFHGGIFPRAHGRGIAPDTAFRFLLIQVHPAVVLFIVISGLGIRLSQRARSSFSVFHFYWRRFWRIYPPYLIALFTLAFMQHSAGSDVLAHVLLVHNFWMHLITSINGPFWTLALEWQIYLLYPVLLFLHGKYGSKVTFSILLALHIVSFAAVWGMQRAQLRLPVEILDAKQLPTTLWLTWYNGLLVADRLIDKKPVTWARRGILLAMVCLVPATRQYSLLLPLAGPVDGIIMSLLVEEFLHARLPASRFGGWFGKWFGLIGVCSYSFYLYFDPIRRPLLRMMHNAFHFPGPRTEFTICYPVILLATVMFSYAAYRLIELPGMALGRSLYARFRQGGET